MKQLMLIFYFLICRIKKRTLVIAVIFLALFLVVGGVGIYKTVQHHQKEEQKKGDVQTLTLMAYVDVSKSNKKQLYLIEKERLYGIEREIPEKYFEEVKGLEFPLVKFTQAFVGDQFKHEKFEVIKKESKEIPQILENKAKALKQIQKRLDKETEQINTELNQLLSQSVQVMKFDENSTKITVKLSPAFTKKNDVSQHVILNIISKHLHKIHESKIYKTIWEKEEPSYPISYTILNEEIAYGDFSENVTKSNNE